jgi:hypothetical protein
MAIVKENLVLSRSLQSAAMMLGSIVTSACVKTGWAFVFAAL